MMMERKPQLAYVVDPLVTGDLDAQAFHGCPGQNGHSSKL